MGKRRRNLFVLLFVLGLVLLSGLVIATKPTRLGLDLKGGVELVYQATPTGQTKEVSGSETPSLSIRCLMISIERSMSVPLTSVDSPVGVPW